MLREVVPELLAENEKIWQLVQRLLRHRYGPRSEQVDLDQLQLALEDQEHRDRGASRDATPPTPPGIRVRTTGFGGLSRGELLHG